MEKIITYFDKQVKVACDEKCEKAWGGTRPKEKLSDDDDDVVYLSDSELGKAPVDPGTFISRRIDKRLPGIIVARRKMIHIV